MNLRRKWWNVVKFHCSCRVNNGVHRQMALLLSTPQRAAAILEKSTIELSKVLKRHLFRLKRDHFRLFLVLQWQSHTFTNYTGFSGRQTLKYNGYYCKHNKKKPLAQRCPSSWPHFHQIPPNQDLPVVLNFKEHCLKITVHRLDVHFCHWFRLVNEIKPRPKWLLGLKWPTVGENSEWHIASLLSHI